MIARRLLIAGSGGSFLLPVLSPHLVSSSPTGFWNTISEPIAVTTPDGSKTHMVFTDDAGNMWATTYTHATHTATTPFAVGSGFSSVSGDIHNAIAIIRRQSDGRLLIVELSEEMASPFARVSTNPDDASAWGTPYQPFASGNYTYVGLAQLSAESGRIYMWTSRKVSSTFYGSYSVSNDDGATWSAFTDVIAPVSSDRTYRRIGTNWVDRIDVFSTSTDRTDATPSSVYHCYMTGGSFYKTDGTLISASQPFVASAGTLVQDASLGPARPDGWAYSSGKPACLVLIRPTGVTDTKAYVARWTGSAWQVNHVADQGGWVGGNRFIASGGMTKADPNEVWLPIKVGSFFELFRYVSYDGGTTWTGTAVTSGSSSDNAMPDTPVAAMLGSRAVWGYGTYVSDSNFVFDVYTYGT